MHSYDSDGLLTAAGALALIRDPVSGDVVSTSLDTVSSAHVTSGFGEKDGLVVAKDPSDVRG